jgi:PAS domain S-box-containing protein
MRVLYVEDNVRDVDLTLSALRYSAPDVHIDTSASIGNALDRLTREGEQYDIVITDIHLPDGDGLSLLGHIRRSNLQLPIVVITGAGDEETAVTALKGGADDYVIKRGDYLDRLPLILEDATHRFRAQASRRSRPLTVLYAERNKADIDLTIDHFLHQAPHIRLEVALTGSEVLTKLAGSIQRSDASSFDVLLLDYQLPQLNALEVLEEVRRQYGPDIPVVVVTGQGSEEIALQAIKLGGASYLVKNPGYLYQLPGELENAFYRAQLVREQRALRESEERYRSVVETQTELICRFLPDSTLTFVNDAYCRYFGKSKDELIGRQFISLIPEGSRAGALAHIQSLIENPRVEINEHEVITPGGTPAWQQWVNHIVANNGTIVELQGAGRDVTERRMAEESLRNALLEVGRLKEQLHAENQYLREAVGLGQEFGEPVGESESFRAVLSEIEHVARTQTTVLLLGETGTGKEVVAHALHRSSSRANRPLIKVDCTVLPTNLFESELFGHERGAFTGAHTSRAGRFEVADKATIFLDEIGEVPLELQVKLLRVLQEGEFTRVGSNRTIKVDVRVIAATNRDLEEEVRQKRFRADLYYRLNVYPVLIPPLRERPTDIPILARHFTERIGRRVGKVIDEIPDEVMAVLTGYSWPGNIRELRNVIERAVIITPTRKLQVPDKLERHLQNERAIEQPAETPAAGPATSLEEIQRQHIVQVLNQTLWRIEGARGAAAILGVNPGTLRSRIKRLGIKKPIREE